MHPQKTVKAFEAKSHFSELLDCVERGESIAITRHGVHVATLIPPDVSASAAEEAVRSILARREKIRAEGRAISMREMMDARDEGRK